MKVESLKLKVEREEPQIAALFGYQHSAFSFQLSDSFLTSDYSGR